ncbi:MAG: DUF167 domain-containing protein [Chloracidobacterium sp.]|nr:DUF167 domain-containing protein [Chloracidobacterium sp.]
MSLSADTAVIAVKVVPRTSRSEVVGWADGILKVRLTSPPVDGAANDELVRLIAKRVGVARSNVEITRGLTSRNKTLRIHGITAELLKAKLAP